MPPRSIKVVKIEPAHIDTAEKEKEYEEEEPVPSEENPIENNDDDSEDLEALVQEYTKERKLKQRANEVKSQCQHCDKLMSSKTLKYSHQKNCKKDPINNALEPEPEPEPEPGPEPEPPKQIARKPSPATVKRIETKTDYEIQPDVEIKQPSLTTNYVHLKEVQRVARHDQKVKRMKILASQAF